MGTTFKSVPRNQNQEHLIPSSNQKPYETTDAAVASFYHGQTSINRTQQQLEKQIQLNPKKKRLRKNWLKKVYFTPESKFIIFFKCVLLVLIYLYFIEIPITIGFENHRPWADNEKIFWAINIPSIIIFLIGIVIKLKTAYYDGGILIYDQKQIIKNYLIYYFVFDFFSISAIIIYQFFEIIRNSQHKYRFIVVLFYLKTPELLRIEKSIISLFQLNRRAKAFFKLFLLLGKIFLICNFAACGFFYISDKSCPILQCADCCWVQQLDRMGSPLIDAKDWTIQYTFSLYWASTTMLSIGYGDITPANVNQVIYTISAQFISCVIFAFGVNQIWSIIQEKNAKRSKIQTRLNIINVYMRDKNVSLQLKSRVNAYLSYFYHTKNLRQKQLQREIITELTPSLKKEIYFESYGFLFKTHPFFSKFSEQFLEQVSLYTREVGYFEEQIIYQPSAQQPISLYYIYIGQLQSYVDLGNSRTQNLSLEVYEKGQTVGLFDFARQLNYKSSLMALKYSLLYILDYQNWLKCLKESQKDFQIFCYMKHSVLYQNKMKKLQLKCKLCDSQKHQSNMCLKQQIESISSTFLNRYLMASERTPHNRNKIKPKIQLKSQYHPIYQQFTAPNKSQIRKKHSVYSNFRRSKNELKLNQNKKQMFHKYTHKQRINKILQQKKTRQFQLQDWEQQSDHESEILRIQIQILDCVQNYHHYCPIMNATMDFAKEKRRKNTVGRLMFTRQ